MTLTVEEISKKQFDNKMRGYNPSEVNEFLRQVASEFQALQVKNHELTETIKANEEKLKYFTDLKDSLNKSILVAQEAADKVKTNAKREAEIMIREAQSRRPILFLKPIPRPTRSWKTVLMKRGS